MTAPKMEIVVGDVAEYVASRPRYMVGVRVEVLKLNPKTAKVKVVEADRDKAGIWGKREFRVPRTSIEWIPSEGLTARPIDVDALEESLRADAEAENRFEMLAAFGPGVEVVDVFTGKRYNT